MHTYLYTICAALLCLNYTHQTLCATAQPKQQNPELVKALTEDQTRTLHAFCATISEALTEENLDAFSKNAGIFNTARSCALLTCNNQLVMPSEHIKLASQLIQTVLTDIQPKNVELALEYNTIFQDAPATDPGSSAVAAGARRMIHKIQHKNVFLINCRSFTQDTILLFNEWTQDQIQNTTLSVDQLSKMIQLAHHLQCAPYEGYIPLLTQLLEARLQHITNIQERRKHIFKNALSIVAIVTTIGMITYLAYRYFNRSTPAKANSDTNETAPAEQDVPDTIESETTLHTN